ncbi:hypothetical protein HID58_055968 [Brassica napus]|uniref:Uncharacterized protein n=1 Tax=Brassica napus TaxID=3708 RepID=A0ABQ8ALW3_BRANA|nr:hypothetical protein HID58_055968 [Brassica napus]
MPKSLSLSPLLPSYTYSTVLTDGAPPSLLSKFGQLFGVYDSHEGVQLLEQRNYCNGRSNSTGLLLGPLQYGYENRICRATLNHKCCMFYVDDSTELANLSEEEEDPRKLVLTTSELHAFARRLQGLIKQYQDIQYHKTS